MGVSLPFGETQLLFYEGILLRGYAKCGEYSVSWKVFGYL